jgi:hypothetical protein
MTDRPEAARVVPKIESMSVRCQHPGSVIGRQPTPNLIYRASTKERAPDRRRASEGGV